MDTPLGAYVAPLDAAPSEKTSTGGWPTGVLELQGGPTTEPTPVAPASLTTDPFAAFAVQSAAPPEPTPPGHGLEAHGLDDGAREGRGPDAIGALPVTDLSDLERTSAAPLQQPPDASTDLSLEERTPAAAPLREPQARWGDPEATSAVAIGPDGFQEVDLAASSSPPDPAFDAFGPEPTPVVPLQRAVEPAPAAAPPEAPGVGPAGAQSPAEAVGTPAKADAATGAAVPATEPAPREPARYRAFAMNVLSLAALLVVTAGMLVWWRGEGIASLFRPRGEAGGVEVSRVTSGVYGGDAGIPLVFVRGVVRAPHGAVQGPVLVRVDLMRGRAAIATTTAVAGPVPGPEELAAIATPADADRLRDALARRAAPRVDAGAEVPFLAFLPQPPGDPGGLTFRVVAVPAAGR